MQQHTYISLQHWVSTYMLYMIMSNVHREKASHIVLAAGRSYHGALSLSLWNLESIGTSSTLYYAGYITYIYIYNTNVIHTYSILSFIMLRWESEMCIYATLFRLSFIASTQNVPSRWWWSNCDGMAGICYMICIQHSTCKMLRVELVKAFSSRKCFMRNEWGVYFFRAHIAVVRCSWVGRAATWKPLVRRPSTHPRC